MTHHDLNAGSRLETCPVCRMRVDPAVVPWTSERASRTYHFCAPACQKAFDRAPERYLARER